MNVITQISTIFNRFILKKSAGDMLDTLLLEYDDGLVGGSQGYPRVVEGFLICLGCVELVGV